MSIVYSKPSLTNPELPEFSDTTHSESLDSISSVLSDKIKTAIGKIKLNKCFPTRKRYAKFPCSVCDRNVNTDGIYCTNCLQWVHRKCNGTTKQEYKILSEEPDDYPFTCIICTIEHNAQIFPLTFLDKIELNELNEETELSSLPPYEVHSKFMKLPSLNDFDMDEKPVNAINSNYYDISGLCNVYNSKSSFSLFRSNLRSLSKHIDELQILLRSTKIPFDIIGVSETKEQVDKGFLTNVNLYGYDFYSQPSKASAGGVAVHIISSLNYVIRDDLNRTEDEFECIWVEIKNSKSQNILCCCAYRHPNSETQKFLDYIESTLSMAKKEKSYFLSWVILILIY